MVRALTLERAVNEYFYRIINSLHRLVPLGLRSALALLALDKGDLEKVHPQRNFLARLGQGFGDNRMVSLSSLLLDFDLDGVPVGEVAVDADDADVLGAEAPVVFAVELPSEKDETYAKTLYTSASRAQVLLYLYHRK